MLLSGRTGGEIDVLTVLIVVWAILIAGFLLGWILRVLLGRGREQALDRDQLRVERSESPEEIDLTESPAHSDGERPGGDETLR